MGAEGGRAVGGQIERAAASSWVIVSRFGLAVNPFLNWANVCSPEQTSDTSTDYDSFLN